MRAGARQSGQGREAGAWLAVAVVLMAAGRVAADGPQTSPRNANYAIEATLDPAAKTVRGHARLHWRNLASEPAPDLCFHLYLNAFANNRTTLLREYQYTQQAGSLDGWTDGWGWIDLTSIRVNGEERTAAVETVHPDDANPDDRTVARLPLAQAVPPRGTADIEMDFVAHLPKLLVRTGYAGDFFFVAQWFPKIGVFEDGHWNCHQYHLATEFFADFGVYDVRLTVPASFVVGAAGVREEEKDNGDGSHTLRFRAEDVHDFAWTADPSFEVKQDRFGGAQLALLCRGGCRDPDRQFTAVKHALAWFNERIGPYPYQSLTMVDPGWFGAAAAGMEYPTLITLLPARWVPRGVRLPEFVAIHELGHQYWYGMVANNEFEEAWLDEGLTSYTEGKIMDAAYGADASYLDLAGLRMNAADFARSSLMLARSPDPIMLPAWRFRDRRSYRAASYAKTALALRTLEADIGEERVLAGLRRYFERWRFGHPKAADFFAAMSQAAGEDLGWLEDEVFRHAGDVDYAVTRVASAPGRAFAGVRPGGESAPPATSDGYESTVVAERLGSARLPVDVAVTFADGTEMRERWDGRERWRRFEYRGTHGVSHAVVDPSGANPLDVNPLNNSRMRKPGTRGLVRLGLRWGFWLQNLLHALTAL